MILKKVELFLEKYNLLSSENNIIVAFSGGYDSMCLLHVMQELSHKYDFKLIAIHLNHNWRGNESDLEELNCKNFCKNVKFYSEKLSSDIPHTETSAREARYRFFEKCAEKFNSKIILTAHNANDNAETVFYRFIRGTGIKGLVGIAEHRDIYYRPLLSIYRDEIEKYCEDYGLSPNCDSSNLDTKYARNKIRLEIFPQIKDIFPDYLKNINNLSQCAFYANGIIKNQIKTLTEYNPDEFLDISFALKQEIVHNFFIEENFDYDKFKIESCIDFIQKSATSKSGKTYSLSSNKFLFVSNKKIKIINKEKNVFNPLKINTIGKYNAGRYIFEITETHNFPDVFPNDAELVAYVEIKDMDIDFELRTRRDGDRISPLGMSGSQKLKKYLTEKEIPKHEKDNLILLTRGKDVLWVAGVGLSDKIKVVTHPTHVIRLTER